MKHHLIWMLAVVVVCGCSKPAVTRERYFGGKTVDTWLAAMSDSDPDSRKKAADVLGNVGPIDSRSIPALTAAVKDEDPRVRDAAVLGLSKMGSIAKSAAAALTDATHDSDPLVRQHAQIALERVNQ